MTPDGAGKLLDMLREPAMRNYAGKGYGQIAGELSPRIEDRPEGVEGPAMQSGAFLERPGRPFTQADATRLAEIETRTGVKIPAHLAENLRTPAYVGEREAETRKHGLESMGLERRARTIEELPDQPGPAGISPRQAATLGVLPQILPQRERPEDPLLEQRRGLIEAQTAAAGRSNLERPNRRRVQTRDLGDRVETFDVDTGETIDVRPKGVVSTQTRGRLKESNA